MKINIKSNTQKMFMDIKEGDTFLLNGDIYIKVYDPVDCTHFSVRLKDGFADRSIDDIDDVIMVDTELNVNNSPF